MTVSQPQFNASNSIVVRLKIDNKVGMLASVNQVISEMTRLTLANIPTLLSILRRTIMLLLALNGGWLTVMIYSKNKWLR